MLKSIQESLRKFFPKAKQNRPPLDLSIVTLAFPGELERKFKVDYYESSIRLLRISFLLGIIYYAAFALLDSMVLPEVKTQLFIVRFLIVVPVLFLVFILSFTRNFYRWWQFGAVIATLTAGVGIVVMTIISPELGRNHYYPGAMLVLFYCYMLIKLRFIWASLSGWLIFLSYVLSTLLFPGVDANVVYINFFFLASANILGMFGGYALEYYTRRDFYYRYLLRQERVKVEEVNEMLEQKVKEKTRSLEEDIQRRKCIEKELTFAKEKAEESDRLKSAFLANMSHEIRTPMNGILGFTYLLSEPGLKDDEQQKYIDIIQKSGKRMLNTVNDLMDISRIETGLVVPDLKQVDVIHEMDNLYNFFKPEAEQKGLKLILNRTELPLHLQIQTDPSLFESVLTNLLKNAIKYTPEGYVEFGLKTQENWLEFYVKDSGIGIPANRQEAVFDRFVQADIFDVKVYEGSGLGLSITRAYVEMLGGKIWLNSTEGRGSSFFFTMPFKNGKEDAFINENAALDKNISSFTKKPNLLIVEDDASARFFLEQVLRDKCKSIHSAASGMEAVEIARTDQNIDLILMDIKMPEMNGYEATRLIRSFNHEVVIIAQTAYALEGDRQKALEAGCNDYISKPINKKTLFTIISKNLNKFD